VASLDRDLAVWDYETRRIQVFADVSHAFIETVAAQRSLSLADTLVVVAEGVLESVRRRVQAGASSPVELSRARVELETVRVARAQAERELVVARANLAATWGGTSPTFTDAVGDLESMPRPPSFEALVKRLEQSPEIARWTTELQQRQAAAHLAAAGGVPDLRVGAGVRRFNESDDRALLVGLSVPLPLFDRNQGAAQAAERRLAKAAQEQRGVQVAVLRSLTAAFEALMAAYDEVQALRSRILPEADSAFVASQTAYQQGRMRLTDVLDTQRRLFELRARYFNVLAGYHTAAADLESLIGESLTDLSQDSGRPQP
jgi:cobalt-zinc-cadmium efflux system outer membrane protein